MARLRPPRNLLVHLAICLAGSTSINPCFSADWHKPWSAGKVSTSARAQLIQQADIIAKQDSGYYERIGENRNTYNITNNNNSVDNSTTVNNDNRTGSFQQTYSVGALNASTNTVSVEGNGNRVNTTADAENSGSVDASIVGVTESSDLLMEVILDAVNPAPQNRTSIGSKGSENQDRGGQPPEAVAPANYAGDI